MKVRSGFVSNSSSSSFIVVFDKPELTIEYLKEKLYHGATRVPYEFNWGGMGEMFDTDTLCKHIVGELVHADTREKVEKAFRGMSNYDDARFPEFPEFSKDKDSWNVSWKEYEKQCDEVASELTDEFMSEISENEYIFLGEFSDDCHIGSQLEHGGTFDAVKSIRINNH